MYHFAQLPDFAFFPPSLTIIAPASQLSSDVVKLDDTIKLIDQGSINAAGVPAIAELHGAKSSGMRWTGRQGARLESCCILIALSQSACTPRCEQEHADCRSVLISQSLFTPTSTEYE